MNIYDFISLVFFIAILWVLWNWRAEIGSYLMENIFGNESRMVLASVFILSIYLIGELLHDRIWHGVGKDWYGVTFALLLELARDFGIALIIAAAIIYAIENNSNAKRDLHIKGLTTAAKKEIEEMGARADLLMHKVSEHSLDTYFQKSLPAGWFEYIKSEIQNSTFIRSNVKLRLTVSEPTKNQSSNGCPPSNSVLELILDYKVTNISAEDEDFEIRSFIEFPYEDHLRDFPEVSDVLINGDPLSGLEMREAVNNWPDSSTHRKFKHVRKLARGQSIDVKIHSKTVRLKSDRFVWVCGQPSKGIQVEMQSPEDTLSFLSVCHSDCAEPFTKMAEGGKLLTSQTNLCYLTL